MGNKTKHEPGTSRVIGFIENEQHTVLIDANSNMLSKMFEFFNILVAIRNKHEGENNKDFQDLLRVGFGSFSGRDFYKVSFGTLNEAEFNMLVNHLDHNLILYANED